MFDPKREDSGLQVPPRPEPPAPEGWTGVKPPPLPRPGGVLADSAELEAELARLRARVAELEGGEAALTALVEQAHALERRIDELVEELAARDVSIAELEHDNRTLRDELRRRGDDAMQARAEHVEIRDLLHDSQERVELLEQRLREELAKSSTPPQRSETTHFEREVEMARTLIESLEAECRGKESKIADLGTQLAALRNILRYVDAAAIEAAKQRMDQR